MFIHLGTAPAQPATAAAPGGGFNFGTPGGATTQAAAPSLGGTTGEL